MILCRLSLNGSLATTLDAAQSLCGTTTISKLVGKIGFLRNQKEGEARSIVTNENARILIQLNQRLCVVYKVVNLLVFFEPASLCDLQTDLVIAPLPAKRQLWEADNEFSWKAESESGPGIQTPFGLAASGELVKLDEGQPYCGDVMIHHKPLDSKTPLRNTTNWEEWCSGMDGLGGLVMLAASLVA